MEQKNRLLLTLLVIALIVGAMFTSFGRGLFALHTPQITLPDTSSSQPNSSAASSADQSYLRLEVTPETVQSVIATLSRTDSYYRELTVERFWSNGSSSTNIQVWTDGGWTKVHRATSPGPIRWDLIGPDEAWLWYDNSRRYVSTPVDELTADLAQLMPTYDTVLALNSDSITDAGYEDRGGLPCVYVEAQGRERGYILRYWVNIQSGLLVSAETEVNGQLVYCMTAYTAIQSPCPSTAQFSLPDGTVMHTI